MLKLWSSYPCVFVKNERIRYQVKSVLLPSDNESTIYSSSVSSKTIVHSEFFLTSKENLNNREVCEFQYNSFNLSDTKFDHVNNSKYVYDLQVLYVMICI